MSTDVQTAVGRFVWHDLMSTDVEGAKSFYTKLLGWTIEVWKPGEMDYPMILNGDQMHGGIGPAQGGAPSHWMGHVLVESVDDAVARAEKAGGKVLAPPMDIPEVGRMAVIADPQGAVFSVFTPETEMTPSEGTFAWDELMTTDVDAAKSFYGEVVGWTTGEMDMGPAGTYTLFRRAGDVDSAGLMKKSDDMPMPAAWLTYVATDDVDATAARAGELGGSTVVEPFDIMDVGRIAIVADPAGGVFGLWKGQG
jgi:predicted enzyme related to lactoylglutathione lyase